MNTTGFVSPGRRLSAPWLGVALVVLTSSAAAFAATITVDTSVDDDLADGECSLREAILAANTDQPRNDCPAGSGPDRVVFTLAKGSTIALGSALPTITDTLLVRGPGADLLAIDGQDLHPILNFDPPTLGRWLGVEEVTLTRGFAASGGGGSIAVGQSARFHRVVLLANRSSNGGGGLAVAGAGTTASKVEIVECWFAGNQSLGPSGGGGLFVSEAGVEVLLERTTLSGNQALASGGSGGALMLMRANAGLARCTISGNGAAQSGGGIALFAAGGPAALSLSDSTLTANRADDDGDTAGDGGGIYANVDADQSATLALGNSILAGNVDSGLFLQPDVAFLAGGVIALSSAGFNLVGSNAGAEPFFAAGAPNPGGDYVGTAVAPIAPQLNALADNGGFAPDHRPAIVAGTPLIDRGFCTGSPADQRGYGDAVNHLRIVDTAFANGPGSDGCDIGSHERAGDPGADPAIFSDGFEWGHTLDWSTELL